ncbi:MAG TPA: carboxypeptidase regulatory-like domain-containing protein [Bacteroidota bacterium]|nr:carboxypeptidase regulatory-like domain-containing protein [Bacteroidota bacterium]
MKLAMTKWFAIALLALLCIGTSSLLAQGVTTAAIGGKVLSSSGEALPGANIIATHVPSGTTYGTSSRPNGSYVIPNIRVGGPYTVTVSFVGYRKVAHENIFTNVSQTTTVDFTLSEEAVQGPEMVITAQRNAVMSAGRTGAATNVDKLTLSTLPTISGKVQDFIRLTPEARGNTGYGGDSYVGQDSRYNNTTVDGAAFNNSFGLMGQVGERTGVAPISLDAIEQVQVNIAPYDVRQGNFVGAAMNTVTKSGTNELFGTLAYAKRNQRYVSTTIGTNGGVAPFNPGTFDYDKFTVSVGGPIIKNKLFFFANYEGDKNTVPGTYYTANPGSAPIGGNMTRVLQSDLDALSTFLTSKFNYNPGSYQGYNFETPGKRYLAKLDYNLDQNNKIVVRYNRLDSSTPVLVSNSSSLGFGSRRGTTFGLNYAASNYSILENDYSIIGEWNSIVSDNMSNNLLVGYSYSNESRGDVGTLFPFVDILNAGTVYTSFGSEPFTPNNELYYWSYQMQDNFTWDLGAHVLTFGVAGEKYHSENVFFPGKQSVYVYNSLTDFYTDANNYLNKVNAPGIARMFQVRYINIPGMSKPVQPLDVYYWSAYAQDEYQATKNLKLTLGLRLDMPTFGATGFDNANADALTFMDETGSSVKYNSGKLPDAQILFSPRLGFNYDVFGDRTTQIRGGTGIFTGKPAYVWISNQIGNTGVLTGFLSVTNSGKNETAPYQFNPNPDAYKPTNVTGAPASTYELALTDPNFKFPQQWRSNIAVDQRLPFDLIGTVEFLYGREINGIYYINANQTNPNGAFTGGPDTRARWISVAGTNITRINQNVQDAVVMKNEDKGYNYTFSASLERPMANGFYGKVAYNYGVAKNTVDAGSIAFGSWSGNQVPNNPNNAPIGYSPTSPGARFFTSLSYRAEYFNFGATTVSLFWDIFTYGNGSYTYSGDLNGDGNSGNDLVYIPRTQSEMNFVPYTTGGVTFTAAQQAAAWDAYITQDPYLSKHRGSYAERGGAFLPLVNQADLSIVQTFYANVLEKRQNFEIRLDILNVGNLISSDWGQAQHFVSLQPLTVATAAQGGPVTATGAPQFTMRAINGALMDHTFERNNALTDVYRFQLGLRYYF